jgi:hypothetical protein
MVGLSKNSAACWINKAWSIVLGKIVFEKKARFTFFKNFFNSRALLIWDDPGDGGF